MTWLRENLTAILLFLFILAVVLLGSMADGVLLT